MNVFEGSFVAPHAKVAIVISRFNSFVNESLLSGAVDVLKRHGQVADDNIAVFRCPGAVELPLVAQRVAKTGQFDAIIALGAVIRGGTPHFEYVSSQCNSGLSQVALEYNLPVAFGVLTVDTIDQAIERAGTKAGNKGAEAALSTLEMINVLTEIDSL